MRWRDLRIWFLSFRWPRQAARLQHDQVIEQGAIVAEIKEGRRRITHDLADVVLELDAVADNLEVIADDPADPDPDPPRTGPHPERP